MSNADNTPINQDQSNKSQNGREFNIKVTDHLKAWQDGKVRILVGKEVEIFCKKMVNIDQHQWFRVKFDNVFAIILTFIVNLNFCFCKIKSFIFVSINIFLLFTCGLMNVANSKNTFNE